VGNSCTYRRRYKDSHTGRRGRILRPMCGIIGITGLTVHPRDIETALATLGKRGPDGQGIFTSPQITLGHTRLAIIDLTPAGKQPMHDKKNGLTISFNGEIYNYRELRNELKAKGHRFDTQSDTEVILKAYAEYGDECPNHLDGMFAFAIWDEPGQKLFLARDRFGEKPLYYFHEGNRFAFASEIKALFAAGLPKQEIDPVSLDNFLTLGYIPPWRSMYARICPLPPAHYAIFKKGQLTKTRYWKLKNSRASRSLEESTVIIRELLEKSVKSRMVADVEVGTLLSGGIDSGIVTVLASNAGPKNRLQTFSAGFGEAINELPYAEEIARQTKTQHHVMQLSEGLATAFRDATAYFDEPFADSSCVPTQLLSNFVRQKVAVALSGDGGDELFFGYGHYRKKWHLPLQDRIKRIFADPFSGTPAHLATNFSNAERLHLLRDKGAVEHDLARYLDLSEAETELQKINLIDFQLTLPGDMLTKVDRSSMMHSLEIRSPFLQHRLAEAAFNLPDEYKTSPTHGKIILAEAFGDLLPKDFFTRRKQGFGAPVKEWLRKPDFLPLVEQLSNAAAQLNRFLHPAEVKKVVESYQNGNDRLAKRVWTLLTLEEWLKSHPQDEIGRAV
jgi:asparagine synthase (glutamine-hydrolysing)